MPDTYTSHPRTEKTNRETQKQSARKIHDRESDDTTFLDIDTQRKKGNSLQFITSFSIMFNYAKTCLTQERLYFLIGQRQGNEKYL